MSHGISIFVTIMALVNILAALWLIWWTNRGSKVPAQETTHVWDGDLTEYNNPLPRWWLWLFVISIVFALGYLVLFPGLGNFHGVLNWSSAGQYASDDSAARQAMEARFAGFKDKTLAELSQDPGAMSTARNLFALNCSSCHGSDARGAKGFPNLTDQDWLFGGSEQAVLQTVSQGRDSAMPAWGAVLGHDGVEQVMAYVLSLSGRKAQELQDSAQALSAGGTQFATLCAACHGADAKGNQILGAPNLTDNIWLNGGTVDDIRNTITNGRTGHMPAHLERLGEIKVRLLAAYVLSLSQAASAPPAHAAQ